MRGQCSVVARFFDGSEGDCDVMDLDDESFRAWVIWHLCETSFLDMQGVGLKSKPHAMPFVPKESLSENQHK